MRQHGSTRSASALGHPSCRNRSILRNHRQDSVRLAIQRQRLGPHHGRQILFYRKAGYAHYLDERHRPIAVRTEDFFCRHIELRHVKTARQWQLAQNLSILRAQYYHHRLSRRRHRNPGLPTRRK